MNSSKTLEVQKIRQIRPSRFCEGSGRYKFRRRFPKSPPEWLPPKIKGLLLFREWMMMEIDEGKAKTTSENSKNSSSSSSNKKYGKCTIRLPGKYPKWTHPWKNLEDSVTKVLISREILEKIDAMKHMISSYRGLSGMRILNRLKSVIWEYISLEDEVLEVLGEIKIIFHEMIDELILRKKWLKCLCKTVRKYHDTGFGRSPQYVIKLTECCYQDRFQTAPLLELFYKTFNTTTEIAQLLHADETRTTASSMKDQLGLWYSQCDEYLKLVNVLVGYKFEMCTYHNYLDHALRTVAWEADDDPYVQERRNKYMYGYWDR